MCVCVCVCLSGTLPSNHWGLGGLEEQIIKRKQKKKLDLSICRSSFQFDMLFILSPHRILSFNKQSIPSSGSLHTLPMHHFARLQRHHHRVSELVALRHAPLLSLQLHELLIPRQSVKISTVLPTLHCVCPPLRRERLQFVQTPVRLEDLRVELQAQELAEASSARFLTFFGFAHVGSRVGSQKQSLASRLNRFDERLAMLLAFQNRETVEMGLQTAN